MFINIFLDDVSFIFVKSSLGKITLVSNDKPLSANSSNDDLSINIVILTSSLFNNLGAKLILAKSFSKFVIPDLVLSKKKLFFSLSYPIITFSFKVFYNSLA